MSSLKLIFISHFIPTELFAPIELSTLSISTPLEVLFDNDYHFLSAFTTLAFITLEISIALELTDPSPFFSNLELSLSLSLALVIIFTAPQVIFAAQQSLDKGTVIGLGCLIGLQNINSIISLSAH